MKSLARFCLFPVFLSALLAIEPATAQTAKSGPSGLPIPRFVSLKADLVNVRRGPGKDHQIAWVFLKAGLPVEILEEYELWRRIRDSEGSEGWVFHSLLSGRRTALVQPWKKTELTDLHSGPDGDDEVTAQLQPKVLATVSKCDGTWCSISGDDWSGWVRQTKLWGVYPNEKFQ